MLKLLQSLLSFKNFLVVLGNESLSTGGALGIHLASGPLVVGGEGGGAVGKLQGLPLDRQQGTWLLQFTQLQKKVIEKC